MNTKLKKIKKTWFSFFKKSQNDYIYEYAAQCAFFIVLSFVPFLMCVLTLIQYTIVDKDTIILLVNEVIPISMKSLVLGMIDEVYSKSVGTISITALFALWSASRGFYYLTNGLRKIYKVKNKIEINLLTRFEGIFYTIIFIFSIIAFLIVIIFGKNINRFFIANIPSLAFITNLIIRFRSIVMLLVMFVICLCIYRFIPKHRHKFKTQIFGAAFTSIAWYLTSFLLSIYVEVYGGFKNTYGSLTSIMVLMIWIYFCMLIILFGAELNYFIYNLKNDKNFKNKKENNV